jgi:multisubunit Na+/H+ antiporter MnhE subunit
MSRILALATLAWHFVLATLLSGLQTARMILGPAGRLRPGFVEYRFEPFGEGGAVALACLVTLTPGSTAVDLDPQAGRMRLHLLDTGTADEAIRQIREQFERPLRRLLGRREAA